MTNFTDAINRAAEAAPQNAPTPVPDQVKGRTLLVDGDYLGYYAAGNDECSPGRARQNAIEKIDAFKALSGAEKVVVHLTAPESNKGWRYLLATVWAYQAQRSGSRKPKNWQSLREWFDTYDGTQFKTKVWTDREADDGMAYHAQVLGPELAVVATADKDMRMFSGIHIDWKTYDLAFVGANCFEYIGANGKLYGHKWFWQQMLQGDTADNIPGLPEYRKPNGKMGPIGEKTAEKFLAGCKNNEDCLRVVYALYKTKYQHDAAQRLAEQATLLWMRTGRAAEVDDWLQIMDTTYRPELVDAAEIQRQRIGQELAYVAELSAKGQ